jgi:transcriptional regulator with XRE-family HTH domain
MKSGIAMVRISGAKIRSLREEQNLTQLYLATAVGVTTETISRWERKDAPTIKEENGIKLAESLAVSMEDILVEDEPASKEEEKEEKLTIPVQPKNNNTKFILAAILLAGALVYFLFFFQKSAVINFSAKRIMPDHSVAGHPFPVVIGVDFISEESSSLLLKEQLPSGCSILRTIPAATMADTGFIKWVKKKGSGRRSFAYIASCEEKDKGNDLLLFQGTLLVRQTSRQEVVVNGQNQHHLSDFHWADSNKDSTIDDEELLAVYDDFGSVDGLFDDMEEVESIWMGSSYRWNAQRSVFEIIP